MTILPEVIALLERDPQKWEPQMRRDKRENVSAEITLQQRDKKLMRFSLIASRLSPPYDY